MSYPILDLVKIHASHCFSWRGKKPVSNVPGRNKETKESVGCIRSSKLRDVIQVQKKSSSALKGSVSV